MRRKTARISGYAIIQASAKDQQQVGLVQRRVGRACSMHSNHAEVIGRFRLDCSQTREPSRNVGIFSLSSNRRKSVIAPDSFAPAPTRATGFEDCCRRATMVSANPPSALASAGRACGMNFTGPENSFFAFSMSVRNVDDYRTRTPATRPMKSLRNRFGNFIDGANQTGSTS